MRTTRGIGAVGAFGVIAGLLATGGGVISGCGGGGGTNNSTPTRLVASWRLVRTSGGITGGGYPVTPETETLTFHENGTFTRTRQRQTVSGRYTVTQRKTAFGEDKRPVITYSATTLPDVIYQVDSRNLVIWEEAADGFSREYERLAP